MEAEEELEQSSRCRIEDADEDSKMEDDFEDFGVYLISVKSVDD
jgi:hypothetical protein